VSASVVPDSDAELEQIREEIRHAIEALDRLIDSRRPTRLRLVR